MRPGATPGPASGAAVPTVSEVTDVLRSTLNDLGEVWVRGQVTGAKRAASGHLYFALKDEGAQLPCVMWRTTVARLRLDLADGVEVVCAGKVDVYPPHGKYQLIVHEASPLGLGAMAVAFERLKARLQAEGLFDPARKVPLPRLPRRVALVTARTGAAVRDLVTVIQRRFPPIEIVLVSVRVQGAGAADDVARGLALADRAARADVIVVGRGGGSPEDLWAFNEEPVARAIAACRTPVVSAVGHEIDVTIADLVADVRAATPSQAGELVVPVYADLAADLAARRLRLTRLLRTRLDRAWQAVEGLASRPALRDAKASLRARGVAVEALASRLRSRSPAAELDRRRSRLLDLAARLRSRSPAAEVRRRRQRVDDLAARTLASAGRRLAGAVAVYEARRASVEALSPLRVLGRGWSLTRRDGALVKSIAGLASGDRVTTQVIDGTITSRVEAVKAHAPSEEAPT